MFVKPKICLVVAVLAVAVFAEPSRGLKLQVDPSDAVLVLEGRTVAPDAGVYQVSVRSRTPVVPILRAPGFADLELPPVSARTLASYRTDGQLVLQPTSLRGTLKRSPWIVLPVLALAGLGAAVLRRPKRAAVPIPAPFLPPPAPLLPPPDPLIGRQLGHYRVGERLGSGGMATVYKGVADNGEIIAIKVLRPDLGTAEFHARFEREIQVSMQLDHPNVLRILDWGRQDKLLYLVMEYVDGVSLGRCIPEGGLGLAGAMKYLPGVIEGLAYAHSLGIVHRDLKPDNVMVSRNGPVKLMDFGLARNQEVQTVTVHGAAVGSPEYMAPEQILRGPTRSGLTDKSDQYALGILIFELLSGRRPFEWDDPIKLINMHLNEDPPAITDFRADVPVGVEKVLSKMLGKEPEDRFDSVREAGAALYEASQEVVPEILSSMRSLEAIRPPVTRSRE